MWCVDLSERMAVVRLRDRAIQMLRLIGYMVNHALWLLCRMMRLIVTILTPRRKCARRLNAVSECRLNVGDNLMLLD